MFEILKDSEASVESLSRAYVEAMTFEKKLEGEKTEAHRALMIEQRDYLDPGTKPSKKLIAAKDRWQDTCNKIEAVQFGLGELKLKIADRLKVESRGRLEEIAKELDGIAGKERELKGQYLDLCAKAALVREELKGAETSYNGSVMVRLTPDPKFDFQLLSGEEQTYYSAKIEEYRQESVGDFSETITGKRSALVDERNRLERSLQSDPAEEARRLLDKLCPPPAPEPTEPESRKTSEFTIDYDKIGGPDYNIGQELPYKGVGEILHERANS